MILISLFGGLGNQMFQYASAKALALRLNVELKLDISHLVDRTPKEGLTFRDYELNHFCIGDQIATEKELRKYIPNLWHSPEYLKQLYKIKRFCSGLRLYREDVFFEYNKAFDTLKDNTYLYGYFQTQDYFLSAEAEIRTCFQMKQPVDILNQQLIEKINGCNSVSVHIRRGDYEQSVFELLNMESYYLPALKLISNSVENPRFYIFTNDLEWTKNAFSALDYNISILSHNTNENSYKDMILMSQCKHNICANSSFSWWGAWLNNAENKMVVAPKKWYASGRHAEIIRNLVPGNWIKL
ncbi:MAG: alpha-1,2-fucosyltransferase [Paludibacter sp.]